MLSDASYLPYTVNDRTADLLVQLVTKREETFLSNYSIKSKRTIIVHSTFIISQWSAIFINVRFIHYSRILWMSRVVFPPEGLYPFFICNYLKMFTSCTCSSVYCVTGFLNWQFPPQQCGSLQGSYYLSFSARNCSEDAFMIHGLTLFKSALYKSVTLIRYPPRSYNLLLLGIFCLTSH